MRYLHTYTIIYSSTMPHLLGASGTRSLTLTFFPVLQSHACHWSTPLCPEKKKHTDRCPFINKWKIDLWFFLFTRKYTRTRPYINFYTLNSLSGQINYFRRFIFVHMVFRKQSEKVTHWQSNECLLLLILCCLGWIFVLMEFSLIERLSWLEIIESRLKYHFNV